MNPNPVGSSASLPLHAEGLVVSLHIPKTAGTTLLKVLAAQYGERLQRAYQRPQPGRLRTDTDGWPDIANPACIHGHAVLERFPWVRNVPDARWVTFLRDPLARAVSLYYYLQRQPPWDTAKPRRDVADSVEEFLAQEHNHNAYQKWLARAGRDVSRFCVAGIVERFDESLWLLARRLGWPPVGYRQENVAPDRPPPVANDIAARFRQANAADYAIYCQATALLDNGLRETAASHEYRI